MSYVEGTDASYRSSRRRNVSVVVVVVAGIVIGIVISGFSIAVGIGMIVDIFAFVCGFIVL